MTSAPPGFFVRAFGVRRARPPRLARHRGPGPAWPAEPAGRQHHDTTRGAGARRACAAVLRPSGQESTVRRPGRAVRTQTHEERRGRAAARPRRPFPRSG